ncbi:hypothetical protein QQ045_015085 [Rhodiola kirilowii]
MNKNDKLPVAGGGMYVDVFNRVIPLAYSIKKKNKASIKTKKKNKAGESNTYMDGIYLLLFTYFTKPESIDILETTLIRDDDVVRSSSFNIQKRK